MKSSKEEPLSQLMSENISALLDGEADINEFEATYQKITRNQTNWDVYHLIGDALRDPSNTMLDLHKSQLFIDKCAQAITAESQSSASNKVLPTTNVKNFKKINRRNLSEYFQFNFNLFLVSLSKTKNISQRKFNRFVQSNWLPIKSSMINRSSLQNHYLVRTLPTTIASIGAIILMWSLISPIENISNTNRHSIIKGQKASRQSLSTKNWSPLNQVITNSSLNTNSASAFKELEPYINAHQQFDRDIINQRNYP